MMDDDDNDTDQSALDAYGPFQPGSAARALRHDNAQRGLRTCWRCLTGYRQHLVRPSEAPGTGGRTRDLGRGAYYCSWECYRLDLAERSPTRRGPGHRPWRKPPTNAEIVAEMHEAYDALRATL